MSEIKPTPGPWEATCSNERGYPEWFIRVPGEPPVISYEIAKITSYRPDGTDESDARLIAEAGTVFHSTGLSPARLVEMVKELKAALGGITAMCEQHGDFRNGVTDPTGTIDEGNVVAGRVIGSASAALDKCEGVKP